MDLLRNDFDKRGVLVLSALFLVLLVSSAVLAHNFHFSLMSDSVGRFIFILIAGLFSFGCLPAYFSRLAIDSFVRSRYLAFLLSIIPITLSGYISFGIIKEFDFVKVFLCIPLLLTALALLENARIYNNSHVLFQWPVFFVRLWTRGNILLLTVAAIGKVS